MIDELKRQAEQLKGNKRMRRYYDTLMKHIAELEKAARSAGGGEPAPTPAAPKKAKKK